MLRPLVHGAAECRRPLAEFAWRWHKGCCSVCTARVKNRADVILRQLLKVGCGLAIKACGCDPSVELFKGPFRPEFGIYLVQLNRRDKFCGSRGQWRLSGQGLQNR